MRLTGPNVARLAVPAGRTEIIVFDEALPGFGVRVRVGAGGATGGRRSWSGLLRRAPVAVRVAA